jgi:polysaccharide biosynthesis transport protein
MHNHHDPSFDPSTADPTGAPFVPPPSAKPRAVTAYLWMFYRRRRIMLAVFTLVVVSTVVHTYTRVPVYEARAKLLIESRAPQYVGFQSVEPERAGLDYYQTQYDLLKSRSLARRTLQHEAVRARLFVAPQADAAPPQPGLARRALRQMRALAGLGPASPSPTPAATPTATPETVAETRAVNRLLGGLIVAPLRNSRIVDLKYRSRDPELATLLVNAHARSYIEQNLEFRFTASKEAGDWLSERLAEQRKQVEDASAALQRYREANDALVAADDRDNIVIQRLGDLSRELTRAKTLRLEKESMYTQLRGLSPGAPALESAAVVAANPAIQQQRGRVAELQRRKLDLSQTFLDTHPDMVALERQIEAAEAALNGELARVVEGVRNEYTRAVAQERSLEAALDEQKREALRMNRASIEYGVLNREVESTRTVYQALLQRAQETGVSGEQRTSNVRIVDLAEVPGAPFYPNVPASLRSGLLAGLGLALLVALLFEQFDSRLRTPAEVQAYLHLPPLGLLPLEPDDPDAAGAHPSPRFAESVRALRTNVIFSTGDSACRSLLVTSTSPGEGKTMVSSRLAVALAETGRRVLVIDADMRKPKLHVAFGARQEPGLSNIIVGTSTFDEALIAGPVPGLTFLPAGHAPPNPAELLSSARFQAWFDEMRQQFDWIVIDTPPVMAVTDASVIAHAVTGVVFVVGAEMTNRNHAVVALQQLQRAHGRVLGAVLNRVDVDRDAASYAPYYKREYTGYYHSRPASSKPAAEKV